ncbi:MAG: gamma-glutamyltransferase, partial [Actinomycetota bacterium]|nr:gamma-glutamyltransferase [Actinomycetota bacterium]
MLGGRTARVGLIACVAAALSLPGPAAATEGTRYRKGISSRGGVVATVSQQAGRVGVRILSQGGNAVDAAIATTLAVGVTRPDLCGIGGGGFLAYRARNGRVATLDFREEAPQAIEADAFQGAGIYRSFSGHKTIGVPGTVA